MSQSRDDDKKNQNSPSLNPPDLPRSVPDPAHVKRLGLVKNKIRDNNLFSPPLPLLPPIQNKVMGTASQSNPIGSSQKYFNDLNAAIRALLPNYQALRRGKLSLRTNSLKKLSKTVGECRDEMMRKINSVSNQLQEVDILYAIGIADVLITLHQYLSKRMQGKTRLVDKLNYSYNQNDHHAFRMVALLFKKAYASIPKNILSMMDTVLSKEKEMAMVHVKYLATNVLHNLSDAGVKDTEAYKQVLDSLPTPIVAENTACDNDILHTSQPREHIESGKPSRANRSAYFSHLAPQNSGVDGATPTDEKKSDKGKLSRSR
jgi:hypothetical protein